MGKILVIKGADFSNVAIGKWAIDNDEYLSEYMTNYFALTKNLKDSIGGSELSYGLVSSLGTATLKASVAEISPIELSGGLSVAMKVNTDKYYLDKESQQGRLLYFSIGKAEDLGGSTDFSDYTAFTVKPVSIVSAMNTSTTNKMLVNYNGKNVSASVLNLGVDNVIILSISQDAIYVSVNGERTKVAEGSDLGLSDSFDRITIGSGWLNSDSDTYKKGLRIYRKALSESEMDELYKALSEKEE